MKSRELISEYLPPLQHTESGERALSWMSEFRVSHLPVLKDGEYYGLISDDDIYDMEDPSKSIGEEFPVLMKPFVFGDQHVYDAMKLIADLKITIVPILDREHLYLGSTDLLFLMSQITAVGSISENGSIIVLKMGIHDYTLTQISRIVEDNNAKILSSYVSTIPNSTEIEVTLKINTLDIERIVSGFQRYDYVISETYSKGKYVQDMKQRYDELMNYLSL